MTQDAIHRNTFDGGLNTDISPSVVNQNQYIDAKNVTLVDTGKFLSLQNIKGTTSLQNIITEPNTTVLGVFGAKFQIGAVTNINCLVIFTHETTAGVNTLKFTAYDIDNDATYLLYSKVVGNDYLTDNRVIDGVMYPENGLDILYFTDFYHTPMKLRCYIPSGYTPNFLVDSDITLLRTPALGVIKDISVTTGGSLLTGTYQVAYQLYNTTSNKYSGFSLLTNPIHVYAKPGTAISRAGVGFSSNKKILISITPTEVEAAYYTHFRLAVVENIGTGTTPTQVGVTPLTAISLTSGTIVNHEITSNTQYQSVSIDDVVVDFAAIERIKTLTIKDNRLLLGNIVNKNLTYDNGDVSIVGGGTIVIATGSPYDETFMSNNIGHFRDEVYRYAISYFDDDGAYSSPIPINLSGVTHNRIAATGTDIKYPSRGYYSGGVYYTVMNTSNQLQALGLTITGIDNHPSWAKGFVILRAKRKKNIVFQTPLVPMVQMSGIGALQNYPTEYRDINNSVQTDTTLEPMGPSTVFVPYNMFYGAPAGSTGTFTATYGVGANEIAIGEALPLRFQSDAKYVIVYPQDNIYKNDPVQLTGSEQYQAVDAVLCTAFSKRFDNKSYTTGAGVGTKLTTTFYAFDNTLHYYNHGHVKTENSLRLGEKVGFQEVRSFDNYNDGGLFLGASILDYSKISTQNAPVGTKPTTHRSLVTTFNNSIISGKFNTPTFAGGAPVVAPSGTSTLGSLSNTLSTSQFLITANGQYQMPYEYPPSIPTTADTNDQWDVITGLTSGGYTLSDVGGISGLGQIDGATYQVIGSATPVNYNFGSGNILLVNGDTIRYSSYFQKWIKYENAQSFFYKTNVIEINNVVNNLSDFRYGAADAFNEYIYTGTKVVFTNAEVSTNISTKTSLPKSVTVWGGDCVLSPHTFKVSDNTYGMINQQKVFNNAETIATQASKWETIWTNTADTYVLMMPAFYTNASQYLSVILESEYNGGVVDWADNEQVSVYASLYVMGATSEQQSYTHRLYDYNINLNKQNDYKIFVQIDSTADVTTNYPARVNYTDLKIYQTDIDGFDTVRVGNIYDLQETYGYITKLAVVGDKLFCVQERGIVEIPMGERVIETTDSSQLAIRSGELFSNPLYIDTKRGSQHIGSIVNTGSMLYIVDAHNKAVYSVGAGGFNVISGNGLSSALRTILTSSITERRLIGLHDQSRDHYWMIDKGGSFAYIWNEGLKRWESNIELPNNLASGAVTHNGKVYFIGTDASASNQIAVQELYTGPYNYFGGVYKNPYVKFVANSDFDISKVYDSVLVNSFITPTSGLFTTNWNNITQTASAVGFTPNRGEGNWKSKIGRNTIGPQNSDGEYIQRLRGSHLFIALTWDGTVQQPVNLSTVLTKYKHSYNSF